MSKPQDRTVSKRASGEWAKERNDAKKASSLHSTQKQAEQATRDMLKTQGGGQLTTEGVDGKFRSKDAIPPGNDPNPPRDEEQ